MKTTLFFDSRIAKNNSLRFSMPSDVVCLDSSAERVQNIVKRYNFPVPCLVSNDRVIFGAKLEDMVRKLNRPAIVQYFTYETAPEEESAAPKKKESAVEIGLRLASEREQLMEIKQL